MQSNARSSQVPLERFEAFRSSRIDETVHNLSKMLTGHRMEVARPGGSLDSRVNHVALKHVALIYIQQGVPVSISTDSFGEHVSLFTDLGGETEVAILDESFNVNRQTAAFLSASGMTRVKMGAKAKHLHLTIERRALEQHLEALTGVAVREPIIFAPRIDLQEPGGALINDLTNVMVRHLDDGNALLRSPLVVASLEDALVTAMLTVLDHNHAGLFEREAPALVPRQVRLVEEFILANADKPLLMRDLAAVAGVGVRSIHHAFQQHRGYSPKVFLKRVRLKRARERLLTAGSGETVTEIALDCGFHHFGRFSIDYGKQFGEAPSQTLRGGAAAPMRFRTEAVAPCAMTSP